MRLRQLMRVFFLLISAVFHPLLIVSYLIGLLLITTPALFGQVHWQAGLPTWASITLFTAILPLIAIALLKPLGLLKSYGMPTRKERFIPYIIMMIFYLWASINLYYQPTMPLTIVRIVVAMTLGIVLAFLTNLAIKVSIHAMGAGMLLLWSFWLYREVLPPTLSIDSSMNSLPSAYVLPAAVIISGLIVSARIYLQAHTWREVGLGLLLGLISPLLIIQWLR